MRSIFPDPSDEFLRQVLQILLWWLLFDRVHLPELGNGLVDAFRRRIGVCQEKHLHRPFAGVAPVGGVPDRVAFRTRYLALRFCDGRRAWLPDIAVRHLFCLLHQIELKS